ncbi:hypothetical protein M9H77_07253 [Catharanthus roseus]|uniref:Uncharacterized protein n=1 Tax=Catharanthus roseus TaxID=4058 RepID=A0ACC0BUT0_CATRO|nr:hypothetical protein M9H77_07253 [Catharanthus roseus]
MGHLGWDSLRYKDLMYDVRVDRYQPNWMNTTQYTSFCDVRSSYTFKKKREAAQRNRLQGRAITVEQQRGNSSSSSILSVSSAPTHESCIKKEKRLWVYMQQAQDNFAGFMTSFTSQCGVQLDSVPILRMIQHFSH